VLVVGSGEVERGEAQEDWLVIFFQILKDIADYFSLDLRF
jgi:hypothetical protein